MDITKKPYEISLWEDVLTFVYEDGYESESKIIGGHGQVKVQYYKERKLCIIGSDTMDTPIRAVQAKLNSKVNGENILTFNMHSHYYDEETNEYLPNPFIGYLVNERKVKLRHGKPGVDDTKWYDFVIKDIQENSETKTYTYTAKDLFINELSKSGFNLVFNAELENNTGNIETLAGRILEESDWQLEGVANLEQTVNEPLYIIKTSRSITANNLKDDKDLLKLDSGAIIYAFYNNIINAESELQFLYAGPKEEDYEIDDNSVITNSSNWIIETTYIQEDGINKPDFASTITISDKFRGKRLVMQQRVDYDSTIDKYVKVYNDGQIYGFTKTEYTSPATVRSFVSNASGYESTNNWKSDSLNLEVVSVPDFRDIQNLGQFNESDLHSCLKFSASSNQSLYNSGIVDNRQYIDNFAKGEEYIFKIKCGLEDESGTYGAKTLKYGKIYLRLSVREYELKDGKFDFTGLPIYFDTGEFETQAENNGYSQVRVTCQQGLSYSQMLEKGNNLGLFVTSVSDQIIYIEDLQFFKYIDKGSDTPLLPDEIAESKILTTYYYYKPDSQYTSIEDLIPEAKSAEPISDYKPAYHDNKFEKIRSITASESNRFNLIQKLCEIFECWPKFRIKHKENGEILIENYRQKKFVSFHEYVSNSDYNWAGFKYGINLKSIQRTLQSDSIATKLIVKDNSNEFAQDGACSIARATENPCGENFILDFGYYIQQGLLGLSELTNDLYLNTSGYIGYYTNLKHYNSLRDQYIQEQSGLLNDIAEYTSIKQTYENSVNQKEDQLRIALIEIKQVTGLSFEEFIEDKDNSWWNDNRAIALVNQIGRLKASIPNHRILANNATTNLETVQNRYDELNRILTSKTREGDEPRLLLDKQELHLKFYKKYSRFLQEGSWISEDYIDNNLYFLDAQSTLYTSSRPRVEYNISVLELSQLKDYESFTFSLGDKTYIEDVEFFGWAPNGSPYREEIVVTELIAVLDSPELNEIKVQNYKTQFEELFQRMAATTQAIEYSTGKYQRAADVIESDGTISITTLQNSIANNALIISNSKDQSVVWDETGITTTSPSAPNEMVRLVSGGLFLSNDGGITWNVGVTGRGISASYITSGTIDTEQIRILNGAFPTFRWDSTGLNAYRFDTTEAGAPTNFYNNEFVRLDQYGLYGIRDQADFNPNELTNGLKGIEKIKAYSNFALTWDGFQIKSTHNQGGYISITSENDFQVFNRQEQEVIKIGLLYENTTLTDGTGKEISGPLFGIRLKDGFGKTVMEHTNNGKIWIKDELQIGHEDKSSVSIGYLNEVKKNPYGEDTNIHEVFNANDKFIVYEDGTMKAVEGEFEGKIIATSGSIGGVDIEAYKEKIYEIFIESDDGTVFKNGKGIKTLTAHLYYGRTEILSGLTYQWYKNGKEIPYETEQQLTVSPDENNKVDSILDTDNVIYECRITHTT